MFELDVNETFPKREEKILDFWDKHKIFTKSLKNRKNAKPFSFYDGPPFATGLPHYGHLLAGTIKDVVPRYKTMQGYYVPRRFGWDCHGLPVENEIEKANELCGSVYVERHGIAKFNEECQAIVLRYTEEWKKTVNRIGRWVDFDNVYRTMDLSFMESVWWVFKNLYDLGLVYEGYKVMPFSYQLGTPLSNFEANLNYKEVDDPAITVKFQSKDEPNTYYIAWTTTPWTLISNLALTVHPEHIYVKVKEKKSGAFYILAKERVNNYFKEDFEIVEQFEGKKLNQKKYLPLFNYFSSEDAFFVILEEFVTLDEGTGIVHTAPAFGEADFYACKNAGIDPVCPVDNSGRFTNTVADYQGMLVKDADKQIIRRLKEEKKLFKQETVRHRYPFCWRSDTPLIYKAVKTWFVAVEKIKEKIIESNKQIHWVPEHIKEGRFGKWLENARDWAISRNRFWGTPIPIWKDENNDIIVLGSINELEKKVNKKIANLHRQYIDDLTFEYDGKTYKRIDEVFDCWFESGSMPYAQNHYPFENKMLTEAGFPADFIAEGLDQTRGWFYTLNVLSAALFEKPAFKNVIVNGILLAEDGNKMSKRLKNYPEPTIVIDTYGADAVRLYMLSSGAVKADDLCFSEKGVALILRHFLIPFWNSYVFLATYANIYKWVPKEKIDMPKEGIDRWILSNINSLIMKVEQGMDAYDLNRAVEPFTHFIDQLTNWYIRRSRARFWQDEETQDRKDAFNTLYYVLITLSKIAAPFVPFLSEAVYRALRSETMPESVHLCDFPKYDKKYHDPQLEEEMRYVQKAVSIGHALRKECKTKVRQPLNCAYIEADEKILALLEKQKKLILEELNVKEVKLLKNENRFIQTIIKPNFRALGKKAGKNMPLLQERISQLSDTEKQSLLKGKSVLVEIKQAEVEITCEDIVVEKKVKEDVAAFSDDEIVVALDTKITEELFQEGIARELINKINQMRKESKFDVVDRIKIKIGTTDTVKRAIERFKEYISNEVLAIKIELVANDAEEIDINGEKCRIGLERIKNN